MEAGPGQDDTPSIEGAAESTASAEDGIRLTDDEGVGDDPFFQARFDHAIPGFLFMTWTEVDGPCDIPDGRRAANTGVAMNQKAVGRTRFASWAKPINDGSDAGFLGGHGARGITDVVEEFDMMIFRGDPRWTQAVEA